MCLLPVRRDGEVCCCGVVCQGVKFMYDCVTGRQIDGSTGCIMADEMVLSFLLMMLTDIDVSNVILNSAVCETLNNYSSISETLIVPKAL